MKRIFSFIFVLSDLERHKMEVKVEKGDEIWKKLRLSRISQNERKEIFI